MDRQVKKSFIQGLNDNDMLTEIIRRITKAEEKYSCSNGTSINLGKESGSMEKRRAQSAIITCLSDTREFERIKTIKGEQTQFGTDLKHVPKCLQSRVSVIVVPAIHPDDTQPM